MSKENPVYREVLAHISTEGYTEVPNRLKASVTDYKNRIFMPRNSLMALTDPRGIVEIPNQNLSATCLQNQTVYNFVIPRSSLNVIRAPVVFRFNITSTATDFIAPPAYWHTRYEIVTNAGSGTILRTNYNDPCYVAPGLFRDFDDMRGLAEAGNFAYPGFRRDEKSCYVVANTPKDFYLYLDGGFFADIRLMMANVNQDIWIRFYPSGSMTYTANGTANITLNSMSLICPQELMDPAEKQMHINYINSGVFGHNYLDTAYQLVANQTLNASTSTNIKLDSLQGKSAFLLVFLRLAASSVTATTDGYLSSIVDPGDNTTVDIVNGTGASLWCQGTPARVSYLRYVLGNMMFQGSLLCDIPLIPIIFSQDVQGSSKGKINGYFQFSGSTDKQLQINTPALGNGEIQTITYTGGAPSAGYVTLFFKGDFTDPLLFSTSAANAKIALDALPSMRRLGLTSTFSSALNGGASFTITFSGVKPVKSKVAAILGPSVATATAATTTITTEALPGWNSNAAYNIHIYNFYHKDVFEDKGEFAAAYS